MFMAWLYIKFNLRSSNISSAIADKDLTRFNKILANRNVIVLQSTAAFTIAQFRPCYITEHNSII
jgi:hypothetical protein